MRLLLIEANDVGRWVGGRVGPKMHVVPVALLGLASYVRAAVPKVEPLVLESSLDTPTDTELASALDELRPDLIGIRSINFFLDEVRRIIAAVRRWRGVPVVLGGPIVAALGKELFELIPELGLACVGEGELALARLASGEPGEKTPGMLVRTADGVLETSAPEPPATLDELPWPDYSLIDLERYAQKLSYAYNQRRQGVLITSRGCPYRCTYCFKLLGSRPRLRSAGHVFDEIEALASQHGVEDFYIVDDIFNLDTSVDPPRLRWTGRRPALADEIGWRGLADEVRLTAHVLTPAPGGDV